MCGSLGASSGIWNLQWYQALRGAGCVTALGGTTNARAHTEGQTGYSHPIPKAGIGGSPRFAARTPIGIFR